MLAPTGRRDRHLLARRATLVGGVALLAFAGGIVLGAGDRPAEETLAERFVAAWERADYPAMHRELTDAARRATPVAAFTGAYREAAATATAGAGAGTVRPGRVGGLRDGVVEVPVTVRTRVFGTVSATLRLPVEGEGEEARVAWRSHLAFPGVPRGRTLSRTTRLPARSDLLARDGTPLAQGAERTSPLGPVAAAVTGQLGTAPPEQAGRLRARGLPPDAMVGVSGLERVFEERLAGRPGGELRGGRRVLARAIPRRAPDVRTSIDPAVQRAAVEGLAGRLGGVAALRPRTGEILALSGIAFSGLQPPGSTFKIITLAGALEAKVAGPRSTYPVQTGTEIEGVEIQNANGESCGGSLRDAFAHSCNSVFAPLGARLGAERLVRAAEAFGFNADPGIPGAATSSIPAPDEIGDDLAVGSSAIGQGRVQATALQMGWVAATIAESGRRPELTLEPRRHGRMRRAVHADVARQVGRYMVAVVRDGTGTRAAVDGVRVAGKTGTAELRDTSRDCQPPATPVGDAAAPVAECAPVHDDPTDTDAWFAAYAPSRHPRIAVGVLLVQNGTGGETAAPVAKQVLQAGL